MDNKIITYLFFSCLYFFHSIIWSLHDSNFFCLLHHFVSSWLNWIHSHIWLLSFEIFDSVFVFIFFLNHLSSWCLSFFLSLFFSSHHDWIGPSLILFLFFELSTLSLILWHMLFILCQITINTQQRWLSGKWNQVHWSLHVGPHWRESTTKVRRSWQEL